MKMSKCFPFENSEILSSSQIHLWICEQSKMGACCLIILEEKTAIFLRCISWQSRGQINNLLLVPPCAFCTVTKKKYLPRFTIAVKPQTHQATWPFKGARVISLSSWCFRALLFQVLYLSSHHNLTSSHVYIPCRDEISFE